MTRKLARTSLSIAFPLVQVNPGKTEETLESVKRFKCVKYAYIVCCVYGLFVEVDGASTQEIKEIVASQIPFLENIRTTVTLLALDRGTTWAASQLMSARV